MELFTFDRYYRPLSTEDNDFNFLPGQFEFTSRCYFMIPSFIYLFVLVKCVFISDNCYRLTETNYFLFKKNCQIISFYPSFFIPLFFSITMTK